MFPLSFTPTLLPLSNLAPSSPPPTSILYPILLSAQFPTVPSLDPHPSLSWEMSGWDTPSHLPFPKTPILLVPILFSPTSIPPSSYFFSPGLHSLLVQNLSPTISHSLSRFPPPFSLSLCLPCLMVPILSSPLQSLTISLLAPTSFLLLPTLFSSHFHPSPVSSPHLLFSTNSLLVSPSPLISHPSLPVSTHLPSSIPFPFSHFSPFLSYQLYIFSVTSSPLPACPTTPQIKKLIPQNHSHNDKPFLQSSRLLTDQ